MLIARTAWLLAVIGAGALYVSFSAQREYVFDARHQDAASIIEALLLDVLMIVFTLLALGLSRAGKSSRSERALMLLGWPSDRSSRCADCPGICAALACR